MTNSRLMMLVLAAWIPSILAATWLAGWTYVHEVERAAETLQHFGDSLKAVLERELDQRALMTPTLAAAAERHGAEPGVKSPRVGVGAIFQPAALKAVLERFDHPQRVAATVLARDYFVVAATADGIDVPGAPAREDVLHRVSTAEHGFAQSTVASGRRSGTYLAGADRHDWNVVMDDAPASALAAHSREVLLPLLGAAGLLLVIALSTSLHAVGRTREPQMAPSRPEDVPRRPRLGRAQGVDLEGILLKNQRFARKVFGNRFDLKAYVQSNLPPVLLDPVLLDQAILNLVFNARRSLGEGGVIVMVARVARAHETATIDPGRFVCLEVSKEEASEETPDIRLKTGPSAGLRSRTKTLPTGRRKGQPTASVRTHRPVADDQGVDSGNGLGVAQVVALVRQWGGDVQFHRLSGQPVRTCLMLPVADPPEFTPAIREAAV